MPTKNPAFPWSRKVPGITTDLALAWKGSRRWTAALVVAAFPFVFVLDERVDWGISPVLPGILLLAALILLLPFGIMEIQGRLARRRDAERRAAKARRFAASGLAAAGLAWIWLALYMAVGV